MGTPLRKIVFDIGGGAANGKAIKAVQTGGPSGGCLPGSKFDLPVDFDALSEAGSMMGSGGMVVMDESTCMVDVARYFLDSSRTSPAASASPAGWASTACWRSSPISPKAGAGRSSIEPAGGTGRDGARRRPSAAWARPPPTRCSPRCATFREEYEAHIHEKAVRPASAGPDHLCDRPRELHRLRVCLQAPARTSHQRREETGARHRQAAVQQCGICADECKFDASNA